MTRRNWTTAPVVYVTRAVCPYCHSPDRHPVWSDPNGDGSTTLHSLCGGCSKIYKVVFETPRNGNLD